MKKLWKKLAAYGICAALLCSLLPQSAAYAAEEAEKEQQTYDAERLPDTNEESVSGNAVLTDTVSGGELLAKSVSGTYYVDSVEGDDGNDGTSPEKAWKSLEKVNATEFQPGDRILLRAGRSWSGQLWPKGSGTKEAPIVLDQYGEGSRPLILGNTTMIKGTDGDYFKGAAVVLHNQEYWEIHNLEITNTGSETSCGPEADVDKVKDIRRIGVSISSRGKGDGKETYEHIYLDNLYIHDVTGSIDRNNGGILVVSQHGGNRTNFADVRIENCTIDNIIGNGITTTSDYVQQYLGTEETGGNPTRWGEFPGKTTVDWGTDPQFRAKNIQVRGCTLRNIWCDGILTLNVDRPVVEYNVCSNTCYAYGAYATIWPHSSNDALMQFNEVYDTRYVGGDGQAFDVDYNCDNAVLQYNYSHDNEGGFLLLMESANYPVIRYNISQNDGTKGTTIGLMDLNAGFVQIYNNTFYSDVPVFSTRIEGGLAGNGVIANNIFYAKEPVVMTGWATDLKKSYEYRNNAVYQYSSLPDDPGIITAEPGLTAPGTAALGRDSAGGYQLRPDSPCIDKGIQIENNGGRDYWGNPLNDGKPDIGAHEASVKAETGDDIAVKAERVEITSEGNRTLLDKKHPTLQLYAEVFPFEADIREVEWILQSPEGNATSLAEITQDGMVTGKENGTVRVLAKAKDGSGAYGSMELTLEMVADSANQVVDDFLIDDFSKMYEHSGELWMDKNDGDYFGDHARLIRSNKYDTSYVRFATYHYDRISSFQVTAYYQNYDGTQKLPIEDIHFYVSDDNSSWREITKDEYAVKDTLRFQVTAYYQNYDGTQKLPIEDIHFYVSDDNSSWREITKDEYAVKDTLLERGPEGGSLWTKRVYTCEGLSGADSYFKIAFPQEYSEGKFYDPNIGQLVLNLAAEVEKLEIISDSDQITEKEGSLQLTAMAYPEAIPYDSVEWKVWDTDGTATTKAAINSQGLLTAYNNGEVLVEAISKLDSSKRASRRITISGQPANLLDTYQDFSRIWKQNGMQLEYVNWFDGGTYTVHPYAGSTDRYLIYKGNRMTGFSVDTYFLTGEVRVEYVNWFDGGTYTVHPYAGSTDRYLIYKGNRMTGFSVDTYFLTGEVRALQFSTSENGTDFTPLTDVPFDKVEKGGVQGRRYHLEQLPENVHYLKIQMEEGFSWEANITRTQIFFKELPESMTITSPKDRIDTYMGQLQMKVEPEGLDVEWSVLNQDGKPSEKADIDADGLLTGKSRGTVTVCAVAKADQSLSAQKKIRIDTKMGKPSEKADIDADGLLTGKSRGTVTVCAVAKADQSLSAQKKIRIDTKMYQETTDDFRYSEGFETGNADNLLQKVKEHSGGFWHQKIDWAGAYGIYVHDWMKPSYLTYDCRNLTSFEITTLCRYDFVQGTDFVFQGSKDGLKWQEISDVTKTDTGGNWPIVTYTKEKLDGRYHYLRIVFPANAEGQGANINLCKVRFTTEIRVNNLILTADREPEADGRYVIPKLGGQIQFYAKADTAQIPGLIAWKADSSIAEITEDGLLTALDYGVVNVTAAATDGSGISKTVQVEIKPVHPESIVLNKTNKIMEIGDVLDLRYRIAPSNAVNQEVVKTVQVEIKPVHPESIVLNKTNKIMEIGDVLDLRYRIAPSNAVNQEVVFRAENENIVSVDEKGRCRAVAAGETDIFVTTKDGGISAKCHILVSDARECLEQLIAQAKELKQEDYLEESWSGFPETLKQAEQIRNAASSRRDDWKDAAQKLSDAMAQLVKKEEAFAELVLLIRQAEAIDFTQYTKESYEALQNALTAARELLASEVKKEEAFAELVLLIRQAEAIDFTQYTKESYEALQNALTAARELLASEHPAKGQIDEAEKVLRQALDGLQKIEENDNSNDSQDQNGSLGSGDREDQNDSESQNLGSMGGQKPGEDKRPEAGKKPLANSRKEYNLTETLEEQKHAAADETQEETGAKETEGEEAKTEKAEDIQQITENVESDASDNTEESDVQETSSAVTESSTGVLAVIGICAAALISLVVILVILKRRKDGK